MLSKAGMGRNTESVAVVMEGYMRRHAEQQPVRVCGITRCTHAPTSLPMPASVLRCRGRFGLLSAIAHCRRQLHLRLMASSSFAIGCGWCVEGDSWYCWDSYRPSLFSWLPALQVHEPAPSSVASDRLLVVNNYDWWRDVSLLTFLRDVGKHARVGAMTAKESVRKRLASEEGMSFTEFTYQLLQVRDGRNGCMRGWVNTGKRCGSQASRGECEEETGEQGGSEPH